MSADRARRGAAVAAGVLLAAGALGACGAAPDVVVQTSPHDDQWQVTAVFDDALNLPQGAKVKVSGVTVGSVIAITADDYRARVDMAIDDDTELLDGSRFRLRYTTALGELYVEVTPAATGAALADGDVVADPDASTAPTVEDALASASLLVNGGGLSQVQTIVDELNTALDGRVDATRGFLGQTDRFLAAALRSTQEIDRSLDALAGASRTLDEREATINAALRDLRPAAKTLTDNTDGLVRLLRTTDGLAVTADSLVRRTRADFTTIVLELGPVLDKVLSIKDQLVPGLDAISDFALKADDASPTYYLNLMAKLNAASALDGPPGPQLPDVPGGSAGTGDGTGDGKGDGGRGGVGGVVDDVLGGVGDLLGWPGLFRQASGSTGLPGVTR